MNDVASIVEQYAGADVPARIELLIKHYPNFLRLVEGYEQSLIFIIKEEKEYLRRAAKGDLGIRVQTSGIGKPTEQTGIDNVMIETAIKSGDLEIIKDMFPVEKLKHYQKELSTLEDMKEDYRIFQNAFFYLETDKADTLERYLASGRHAEKMAYDMDVKVEALKTLICRARKIVIEQTSSLLIRKYQFR